jgi:hypothetical protein
LTPELLPLSVEQRKELHEKRRRKFDTATAEYERGLARINASTDVHQLFGTVLELKAAIDIRDDADAQLAMPGPNALPDLIAMAAVAVHSDEFVATLSGPPITARDLSERIGVPLEPVRLALYYLDKFGVVQRTKRGREYVCTWRTAKIEYGMVCREWTAIQPRSKDAVFIDGTEGKARTTMAKPAMICVACGTIGQTKRVTRGSIWIEILLWLCFLVPGIIYSIWRLTTRAQACSMCGSEQLIPINSPAGHQLSERFKTTG